MIMLSILIIVKNVNIIVVLDNDDKIFCSSNCCNNTDKSNRDDNLMRLITITRYSIRALRVLDASDDSNSGNHNKGF